MADVICEQLLEQMNKNKVTKGKVQASQEQMNINKVTKGTVHAPQVQMKIKQNHKR